MTRPTLADVPRLLRAWFRLRIWLHRRLYRSEWLPFDNENVVVVCDCGGHARVRRNADTTATISEASCPVWAWVDRARMITLPIARLLP